MPETPGENEIMNLPEVSKYLRVHSSTVYRLLSARILPGYKVGRVWRFNKSQVDQFMQQEAEHEQERMRRRE
jgi:excisionase family DNA binding protein